MGGVGGVGGVAFGGEATAVIGGCAEREGVVGVDQIINTIT